LRRTPLKQLAHLNQRLLPEDTPNDFEFDYIDIASVSREDGIGDTTRMRFASAPSRARRVVRYGDVIVSTVRTYLRAVASISDVHDGQICSTGFAVLTARPGVDPRFLCYATCERSFVEEVVARSTGVSYPAISSAELARIPIPHPDLEHQRVIAAFLDRECERIGAIGGLLADHRSAGIELERRVIDDLFAEVPLTRLGWRASVQTGLTLGGKYADEELVEYPYLRVANVQADTIATTDVATVRVPARIARGTTLRRGDVLMTEGGDIDKLGRGAVWDGSIPDCLHQNHVFAVRCGERLLPEFLAVWTRSSVARSYFERTASRITNIASTNLTKLVRLAVPDLPVADQRAKLRVFDREHRRIVELREQSAQLATGLAEYRDALITEVVTGKLDIYRPVEQQLNESARAVSQGSRPEVLPA
jgi:type I restriction enzyme S subunit